MKKPVITDVPAKETAFLLMRGERATCLTLRAKETLNSCIRGLDILTSSTEEEFLLIGTRLKEFNIRALEAVGLADDIAFNVEEIVTFLQFHDITRQHFEKSLRVCRDMCEKLFLVVKEKKENPIQQEKIALAVCRDLALFCLLEARAIKTIRRTFILSVETVLRDLAAIAAYVHRTAGSTLADEIKTVIREIRVHKTVDAVAQEVLSNLGDIAAEVKQLVAAETWEEIRAEAEAQVFAIENGPRVFPKERGNNGDNVEFF